MCFIDERYSHCRYVYRAEHDMIVLCIKNRLPEGVELSKNPITQMYSDSGGMIWWFRQGHILQVLNKMIGFYDAHKLEVFSKEEDVYYELRIRKDNSMASSV